MGVRFIGRLPGFSAPSSSAPPGSSHLGASAVAVVALLYSGTRSFWRLPRETALVLWRCLLPSRSGYTEISSLVHRPLILMHLWMWRAWRAHSRRELQPGVGTMGAARIIKSQYKSSIATHGFINEHQESNLDGHDVESEQQHRPPRPQHVPFQVLAR